MTRTPTRKHTKCTRGCRDLSVTQLWAERTQWSCMTKWVFFRASLFPYLNNHTNNNNPNSEIQQSARSTSWAIIVRFCCRSQVCKMLKDFYQERHETWRCTSIDSLQQNSFQNFPSQFSHVYEAFRLAFCMKNWIKVLKELISNNSKSRNMYIFIYLDFYFNETLTNIWPHILCISHSQHWGRLFSVSAWQRLRAQSQLHKEMVFPVWSGRTWHNHKALTSTTYKVIIWCT